MQLNFETKAMLGYGMLVLVLAMGTAVSVQRLSSVADSQIARLRAEEDEITLVERLRYNGELIVSGGRGYLLSGDPDLLRQAQDAERRFDENVRALKSKTLSPRGLVLVADAQQTAGEFRAVQEKLLAERQGSSDTALLIRRFETELLPLSRALGESLARLVGYKEASLDSLYGEATTARSQIAIRMYGLLGLLLLAGLGIAWYFARLLGRSYRQEREALETARKALAARDEIMGVVAHDLRNPLGAITMKAALLRMTADPDKVRTHADSIENITRRMEYLIRSMLDVTTIEAGRLSITPARCTVEDVVGETAEMFVNLAAAKQVSFELAAREPGLAIFADRERILQVISNVLGNALKFTPRGGRVTLSVERRGTEIRFGITDTGPGIRPEHVAHVFDRFWKHETQGKKGTGLGLFISKGIIDAHGGRIWAESEPGGGARFYFTVPVVERSGDEDARTDHVAQLADAAR